MTPLKIDLYTEISCPWCIIGQHRLDKVLKERFPKLDADIAHHPILLMPNCPKEGLRVADLMKSRYGITDPSAAWARPHAEARISGLALDLGRQPFAFPTIGGHSLIRLAGKKGTQHQLALAISAAYFHEAKNTGDPDILAEIAADFGFTKDEAKRLAQDPKELDATHREAAGALAEGIRSVPHFVFGGEIALNGNQSEDALAAALIRAMEETQVPPARSHA